MSNNRRYLLIGFMSGLAAALLGFGGWRIAEDKMAMNAGSSSVPPTSRTAEKKIEEIESLIHGYYLYDVDDSQLTEGMYAGLVAGIDDPYSCYYTKEEYEVVNETTEGHYQGIGVVMIQDKNTNAVSVVHCYEGSPAEAAGVRDGDVIVKVDDEEISGKELSDVSALIKANGGDQVKLTLVREGQEDFIEVEVTKASIEIPVVDFEMMEGQVGYIAIRQFAGTTAHQFELAMEELRDQDMQKLIVDLRDNPGGLLSGVCDTLNSFMPEGLLVYTEDKYGNRTEYSSEGKDPIDVPLVVLINENSASASEIFAGAVKDHQVGTLVGTTTYGKGIVQKLFNLDDGSVVKLTISSYYSPNGINIHGQGITPDVEVENPDKAADGEEEDVQLDKAVEIVKS